MAIDTDLEPAVRQILAALAPGATLSTGALGGRVIEHLGREPDDLPRQLVRLADNVPGLCDRVIETATRGYMKGKRVRRCVWHHIASPDMPQGAAHSSPQGKLRAQGTAGAPLADRIQRIEDYLARRDPLFNVL